MDNYENTYTVGDYISTIESRLLNNMIRRDNQNYNVYTKDNEFILINNVTDEEIYFTNIFSNMSYYISTLVGKRETKEKDISMLENECN